ncbi:hypothetical protein, partial [Gordonia sp. UBA7599]
MSVWLGGDEADAIYLGADPVDAVYLGEDQVWPVGGIEYIGSNWNGGTTVVLPSHQAGDFLLFYAINGAFSTPSLPAGKTNIANGGTFGAYVRVGYLIAASSSEVSGTWSNASHLHVMVFRGAVKGVHAGGGTVSANWPALSGFSTDAWVVRLCAGGGVNLTAPAGFTGRGGATSGSYRTQGFDTNGPLGATSVAQVAMSPSTNSVPITIALEP